MKPKTRRERKAAARQARRASHQPPHPDNTHPRYSMKVVGAIFSVTVALIGLCIEVYEFEYVNPKVSIATPGLEGPLSFRVENGSYVDLLQVKTECVFHSLVFGGIQFSESKIASSAQNTDVIASGSSKVTSCGIQETPLPGPVTNADLDFEMSFNIRCIPFVAACRRSFRYPFRCVLTKVGLSCLQGDRFAP